MSSFDSQIPTLEDGQVKSLGNLNKKVNDEYCSFVKNLKAKFNSNKTYRQYIHNFAKIIKDINNLYDKLTRETLQIGIAGPTQIGKSTTYNRLMKVNAKATILDNPNKLPKPDLANNAFAMEGGTGYACSSCIAIYYPVKNEANKKAIIYPMTETQLKEKIDISIKYIQEYCDGQNLVFDINNTENITSLPGWDKTPYSVALRFLKLTKNLVNPETYRMEDPDTAKKLCNHTSENSVWIHHAELHIVDDQDWCEKTQNTPIALVDLPGYGASPIDDWMFKSYEDKLDGLILTFKPAGLSADEIRKADNRFRKRILDESGIRNTKRRILTIARFGQDITPNYLEDPDSNILASFDMLRESFNLPLEALFFTDSMTFNSARFNCKLEDFDPFLLNPKYKSYKDHLNAVFNHNGGIDSLRNFILTKWIPEIQSELAVEFDYKITMIQKEFENICEKIDRACSLSEYDKARLNNAFSNLIVLGERFSGQFEGLRRNLTEMQKVNGLLYLTNSNQQAGRAVVANDWTKYRNYVSGIADTMYSQNVWAFLIEGFKETTRYTIDGGNEIEICGNVEPILGFLMNQVQEKLPDFEIPDLAGTNQSTTNLKALWAKINPEYYGKDGSQKPELSKYSEGTGFLEEKGDCQALATEILGSDFCQNFLADSFIGKFKERVANLLVDDRNDPQLRMDPSYRLEIFKLVMETGQKLPLRTAQILQDLVIKRINTLKDLCLIPEGR